MILNYKWFFVSGFLVLAILNLILPFQIEQSGGAYINILGHMSSNPIKVNHKSGISLGFVLVLSLPFLFTLIIAGFSKYKLGAIFALITSIIQLIAFLPMAFGLTFSLNLFGSPKVLKLGFGYYTYCILGMMLVIFIVFLLRQLPSKRNRSQEADLLDI